METKRVIENVPKVAFAPIHDGKYEFTPYPSCLKAVLKHLGDAYPYHYLLGACGGAFRLAWHKENWEGGNVDLIFAAIDPLEPFKRALDAVGRSYELLWNSTRATDLSVFPDEIKQQYMAEYFSDDTALYKRKIVASIDAGVPVIGFGIVGPPEACIIAGYGDDGETLYGWSMFQEHLDPAHDIEPGSDDMNAPAGIEENGYFRQVDWFGKCTGIIVLGDKREVDTAAVYRRALEWIPVLTKRIELHHFYNGQKAFETYIQKMSDDSEFDTEDMGILAERKMVHYDAMTMIAERDGGARFIRDIANHPSFASVKGALLEAADTFDAAHNEMGAWWQVAGEIWNDEEAQIKATADPGVRKAFIPHIRAAMEKNLAATELIESVLGKL